MTHQPGGAASINRESIPKPSRPTHQIFSDSSPASPMTGILAAEDVAQMDHLRIPTSKAAVLDWIRRSELRALHIELDMVGCIDSRLP